MSVIPSSVLTSVADIIRYTSFLLDVQNIAASLTPSRQPQVAVYLEFTLQNNTYATGTITINGSEVISFTTDTTKVSVNTYSNISSMVVSGISGGTIAVRAIDAAGEFINQCYKAGSQIPCRFFQTAGWVREQVQGQQVVSKKLGTGLMTLPTQDILPNDYVINSLAIAGVTMLKVNYVEPCMDFAGLTHHLEAWIVPV